MVTPPPIAIANIGMGDTILLMIIALVVFGPRRLPQIGRQIGKLMYEFRKASNDFKFQMEEELRQSEEADRRQREEAERQRALAAAPAVAALPEASATMEIPATAATATEAAEAETLTEGATETPYWRDSSYDYIGEKTKEAVESVPAAADEITATASASEIHHGAENIEEPDVVSEAAVVSEPVVVTPRILPPSTGEKVAAERPGLAPTQQALDFTPAPESAEATESEILESKIPESVTPEAERSEPTAHHG